jgi:hypothetical protein
MSQAIPAELSNLISDRTYQPKSPYLKNSPMFNEPAADPSSKKQIDVHQDPPNAVQVNLIPHKTTLDLREFVETSRG